MAIGRGWLILEQVSVHWWFGQLLERFNGLRGSVDFPGGTVDKNLPANAAVTAVKGSVPAPGRFHMS